ncbi:hypothetical protein COX84_00465 [Candidatus Micrarchaeota archaeon CG_4_10_14_0_2_um_filter_49_7]|nr:MAG: hypothetical protein COX84_00465 [Candidatus Micrarchaeota archaeon CG_4_10_14_0_2_um_filter_49_7]
MLIRAAGNGKTLAQRRLASLQRNSPGKTAQPAPGAPQGQSTPPPRFSRTPAATDTTPRPKTTKLPPPKARLEFHEETRLWATVANPTACANSTAKQRLLGFIGDIGFDKLLTMISEGALKHHPNLAGSMDGIVMTDLRSEITVSVSLKKGGLAWHDANGKATKMIPVATIVIQGGTAYLTWAGEKRSTTLMYDGSRTSRTWIPI